MKFESLIKSNTLKCYEEVDDFIYLHGLILKKEECQSKFRRRIGRTKTVMISLTKM